MKKPAAKAHAAHHEDDHGSGHGDHGGGHGDGHCPPPWILTFADMATLLMAFFVMMLMTSRQDEPKFMAFAASMRQTFGRVPLDDTSSQMGGTSMLDMGFGPQSGEQTNDPPGTTPQSGDPEHEGTGKTEGQITTPGGMPEDEADVAAGKALGEALGEAAAKGGVSVEIDGNGVRIALAPDAPPGVAEAVAEALQALAAAAAAGGPDAGSADGPGADGSGADGSGADRSGAAGSDAGAGSGAMAAAGGDGAGSQGEGDAAGEGMGEGTSAGAGAGEGGGSAAVRARMSAAKMGSLLSEEIASGSIDVEQRDGRVFVTVGEGGAFASGSADLTPAAEELVRKLELAADRAVEIVVTGHTDNVPLGGSTFRDNWELASARAASVVRAIEESGLVPNAKLVATSMGETDPIADNATPEGRAKNRRVEIEIKFDDGTTAPTFTLQSP
jgi:chemotaxis protein MotB